MVWHLIPAYKMEGLRARFAADEFSTKIAELTNIGVVLCRLCIYNMGPSNKIERIGGLSHTITHININITNKTGRQEATYHWLVEKPFTMVARPKRSDSCFQSSWAVGSGSEQLQAI